MLEDVEGPGRRHPKRERVRRDHPNRAINPPASYFAFCHHIMGTSMSAHERRQSRLDQLVFLLQFGAVIMLSW